MGKNVVELIIRAKDLASGVIKNFEKNFRSGVRLAKDVSRDLLAIGAATAGVVLGLQRMAKGGAEVIGVKRAFARITDDEVAALKRLRQAAGGTISDLNLMAFHNQALSLGAAKSTEEFARQVSQAKALARALKIDVTEALEKYTVGLSRQSKLRLDDLGIVIDVTEAQKRYAQANDLVVGSLNEAQKAEAFRAEAMRKADELVQKLGDSQLRGAEAAERFATWMENAKNRLMEFVANSPRVAAFFDALALNLQELAGEDVGLAAIEASVGNVTDLRVLIDRFRDLGDEIERVKAALATAEAMPFANTVDSQIGIRKLREELARLRGEAEIVGRRLTVVAAGGGAPGVDTGDGTGPARGPALGGTRPELQGLLDSIRKAESELTKAQLAEKLAKPGEEAEKATEKVRALADELARLRALAGPFGGAAGLILATTPIGPAPSHLLRPQAIEDPAAAFRRRRYSLAPDLQEGTERGLPFGDSLRMSRRGAESVLYRERLKEAEEEFGTTAGVVAATMGDIAADVIRGTATVGSAVTSMIGNILQNVTKNPLLGGVFGGVFAIGAALFGRHEKPRVVVSDFESAAERKLRDADRRPVRITTIVEQNGVKISEIERELYDRQSRDEVVRFPVGAPGLRG